MVETDLNLLWVRGSRYQPQMLGFVEAIGSLLEPSGRLNHVALANDRRLCNAAIAHALANVFVLVLVMHRFNDGDRPRFLRGCFDTFNNLTWQSFLDPLTRN